MCHVVHLTRPHVPGHIGTWRMPCQVQSVRYDTANRTSLLCSLSLSYERGRHRGRIGEPPQNDLGSGGGVQRQEQRCAAQCTPNDGIHDASHVLTFDLKRHTARQRCNPSPPLMPSVHEEVWSARAECSEHCSEHCSLSCRHHRRYQPQSCCWEGCCGCGGCGVACAVDGTANGVHGCLEGYGGCCAPWGCCGCWRRCL